ncbi:MAG: hypothetical protein JNK10_02625 [Cyclobacteriaceae bacterium]|nr:hypothetical protein [Cyclobacteriaceae bacterium]
MRKKSYLFLALLLPGLVFVFLKYAGSNQFDIPVLHEQGIVGLPGYCGQSPTVPYHLPDSIWEYLNGKRRSANVIAFPDHALTEAPGILNAVAREVGDNDVLLVDADLLQLDSASMVKLRTCIFAVQAPRQTVLFDHEGRIRGYYDIRSRDEVDRLRVELKILLKHY